MMDAASSLPDLLFQGGTAGLVFGAAFVGGLYAAAAGAKEFLKRWQPEPPKPKPREYRVLIEDASDNWPMRSYKLPADAVGRLIQDLDRDTRV